MAVHLARLILRTSGRTRCGPQARSALQSGRKAAAVPGLRGSLRPQRCHSSVCRRDESDDWTRTKRVSAPAVSTKQDACLN